MAAIPKDQLFKSLPLWGVNQVGHLASLLVSEWARSPVPEMRLLGAIPRPILLHE